ncbi:TPA: ComF family protein [bacterium]|nr:ComF family protein [bacterium]
MQNKKEQFKKNEVKALSLLIDFFLPADCKICKSPLEYDEKYICAQCILKIERINPPICKKCGVPSLNGGFCYECHRRRRYFKEARMFGVFNGNLKEVIHIFKYEKKQALSYQLGLLMYDLLQGLNWEFDCIAYIPLHKKKEGQRGFNQTKLLSEVISKKRNIPILKGLIKAIDTPSQVGLSYDERCKNVIETFLWKGDKNMVKGKTILLIDDVFTTGTTVEEVSKTLLYSGCKDVFVLCLARTIEK